MSGQDELKWYRETSKGRGLRPQGRLHDTSGHAEIIDVYLKLVRDGDWTETRFLQNAFQALVREYEAGKLRETEFSPEIVTEQMRDMLRTIQDQQRLIMEMLASGNFSGGSNMQFTERASEIASRVSISDMPEARQYGSAVFMDAGANPDSFWDDEDDDE